jgi:hypothetical protein
MLIVLSGEAGNGKDSVAKVLQDKHGFVPYSLSAPLKRFGEDLFGFTKEQCYGPSKFRNEPDPRWARPCGTCGGTGKVYNTDRPHVVCHGTGKLNDNSPRRVFQLLGDDWLRQMIHPDALTMHARPVLMNMLQAGEDIVINDARFENDRANLKEWLGAVLVHVARPGKVRDLSHDDWRLHNSELHQPKPEDVDFVLENMEDWPFPGLGQQVADMLLKFQQTICKVHS